MESNDYIEVFVPDDGSTNPNLMGNLRRMRMPGVHIVPYSGTEDARDLPAEVVVPTGDRADLPA